MTNPKVQAVYDFLVAQPRGNYHCQHKRLGDDISGVEDVVNLLRFLNQHKLNWFDSQKVIDNLTNKNPELYNHANWPAYFWISGSIPPYVILENHYYEQRFDAFGGMCSTLSHEVFAYNNANPNHLAFSRQSVVSPKFRFTNMVESNIQYRAIPRAELHRLITHY